MSIIESTPGNHNLELASSAFNTVEDDMARLDQNDRTAFEFAAPVFKGEHLEVYKSHGASNDEIVRNARTVQTDIYVKDGILKEDEFDGRVYDDEYVERSTYFYVINGRKDAVARQIYPKKGKGIETLPTLSHFECDVQKLLDVAKVDDITELNEGNTVEISALAAKKKGDSHQGSLDATLGLYGAMLRSSLEEGHRVWVMNMEPKLIRALRNIVGEDVVVQIGSEKEYMGPATIPIAINPKDIIERILNDKSDSNLSKKKVEHLTSLLNGIESKYLDKDTERLLKDASVDIEQSSKVGDILHKQKYKLIASLGMLAYSGAAHVLPASRVENFDGNLKTLYAVELATTYPYIWGLFKAYGGKTLKEKAAGFVAAGMSFSAPYAYFYANSRGGYPEQINYGVAAIAASTVAVEAVKRVRTRRKSFSTIEKLEKEL